MFGFDECECQLKFIFRAICLYLSRAQKWIGNDKICVVKQASWESWKHTCVWSPLYHPSTSLYLTIAYNYDLFKWNVTEMAQKTFKSKKM